MCWEVRLTNEEQVRRDWVCRPYEEQEARVQQIFGLAEDEELPDVDLETLEVYYHHLKRHLSFPFAATYTEGVGPLKDETYSITVTGLEDFEMIDEFYGLVCEGREGRRKIVVPLAIVEVTDEQSKNYQLVDDYCFWFWNYR